MDGKEVNNGFLLTCFTFLGLFLWMVFYMNKSEELERKIRILEEKNRRLEQKNADNSNELQRLRRDQLNRSLVITAHEQELRQLRSNKVKLEKNVADHVEKIQLMEQCANLEGKNIFYQKQLEQMNKDELIQENCALQEELKQLRNTQLQLEQDNTQLRNTQLQLEQAKTENQEKISGIENDSHFFRKANKLLRDIKSKLERENADHLKKLRELEVIRDRMEEEKKCNICMENAKDAVFDCGHVSCRNCAAKMSTCPSCRDRIKNIKIIYMN